MIKPLVAAAVLTAFAVPSLAQAPIRTERVQFAKGASSKTIKASIKGYQTVDYALGVRAGQTMTVSLTTSNASAYFNIIAPGADAALFTGSIDGNRASVQIPSSGDYKVRVYLMRNAARRNETANYTLTIGVR
ncbi:MULTISPECIES: hypothetical protein [unclassified Sphingopyxis]|uniref:hypothetical protein n=1 Tax=unclassified Sphingopyxis TaxID=2614943 RepID=UPI002862D565|nr:MULTISPECIES: hypothetical protein [unclassified Sphingopyxis]MDR7058509.1 hypothetical protein [Sphingopyxis sp. BE235]MDR7179305.1 hypothetical protein [Sphingopyxis sp. BE249]